MPRGGNGARPRPRAHAPRPASELHRPRWHRVRRQCPRAWSLLAARAHPGRAPHPSLTICAASAQASRLHRCLRVTNMPPPVVGSRVRMPTLAWVQTSTAPHVFSRDGRPVPWAVGHMCSCEWSTHGFSTRYTCSIHSYRRTTKIRRARFGFYQNGRSDSNPRNAPSSGKRPLTPTGRPLQPGCPVGVHRTYSPSRADSRFTLFNSRCHDSAAGRKARRTC